VPCRRPFLQISDAGCGGQGREGRGNGCKSVLVNIDAVASALDRSTGRLVKYLGKALATNAQCKAGLTTLRGHHPTAVVQECIQDYIDSDVLCGKCLNPETVLEVKNGSERRRCKACGHKTAC